LVPSERELFADLAEQQAPEAPGRGMPRLRQPERHQRGRQVATIDDLVARDHPVRAVWAFVQGLDLHALHDAVKAREGVPGQAPPAPELMMALWLWATVDGVGSARQLTRLCEQHLAYRWLCGGVSMNYHSLSDFRVAHAAVLDRLLAGGVAALVAQGVVALDVLAQDGLRVRAAAGAGSLRRRERWSSWRRPPRGSSSCAANSTPSREDNKAEVSRQKEPRASTTDAAARAMKLADGGFRPAYNMQIIPAPRSQVIVAVDIDTTGSDRGLARPAPERLDAAARRPSDYLVDGGFTKNDDIEWAHASGIRLWCPPVHGKHRTDPYAPRPDDQPGVADWRQRMASEPGKALYKQRATAECPNAWARRMGLSRLLVRGKDKARAVLLWFALAHDMRAFALRRRAMPAAT
jgi:transposase